MFSGMKSVLFLWSQVPGWDLAFLPSHENFTLLLQILGG